MKNCSFRYPTVTPLGVQKTDCHANFGYYFRKLLIYNKHYSAEIGHLDASR
jgi:hypothetical protein